MEAIINLSQQYYNDGLISLQQKDITNAIFLLEKSVRYYARDIDVLNILGLCHYLNCSFGKAHFYWKSSIAVNKPSNQALQYVKELHAEEFGQLLNIYNTGIELIQKNDIASAVKCFIEVIEKQCQLIEPYTILALCYMKLEDYNKAKKYLLIARKKDKGNTKIAEYLDEVNSLQLANTVKNNNKHFRYFWGGIATVACITVGTWSNSMYKKLDYNYKKLEVENHLLVDNTNNMANVLEQQSKEIEEVTKDLDKEVNLNQSLTNQIDVLMKDENQNENNWSELYSLSEKEIFNKGRSYVKDNQFDKAIDHYSYLVHAGIDKYIVAESVYFLAKAYEHENDFVNAEKYYNEYIQLYKNKNYYDDSLYHYGMMLYRTGNVENAYVMICKITEEVPDSIFNNSKVKFIIEQNKRR